MGFFWKFDTLKLNSSALLFHQILHVWEANQVRLFCSFITKHSTVQKCKKLYTRVHEVYWGTHFRGEVNGILHMTKYESVWCIVILLMLKNKIRNTRDFNPMMRWDIALSRKRVWETATYRAKRTNYVLCVWQMIAQSTRKYIQTPFSFQHCQA